MEFFFVLRGWILELLGCRVFEDLSAICGHIVFSVPW